MKTYKELLNALDSMFSDYGGQEIEYPDHMAKCDNIDDLTEEEAKYVFEYNGGDVFGVLEYLDGEY